MTENKEKYHAFCTKHPGVVPVFAQDWYLNAVCQSDKEGWSVVIVERGGQTVGVMPWYWRQRGPLRVINMPHLTKHLGAYFHPDFQSARQQHKICAEFIANLPRAAYFNQNFYYDFTDWLPFYWAGYRQQTHYSYILDDLSDLDQVYAGLSADYRNHKIRKAKEQVRIVTDRSPQDFFRIEKLSFERQGIPFPFSENFFLRYDAALQAQQARHILFAVDEQDRIHSTVYLLVDHDRVYYHMAGDHPELRSSGAGILLTWEAIRFTKEQLGLNIFDFEGSMIQPIERVRRQFGARQQAYSRIYRYNSRWLQMLDAWRS